MVLIPHSQALVLKVGFVDAVYSEHTDELQDILADALSHVEIVTQAGRRAFCEVRLNDNDDYVEHTFELLEALLNDTELLGIIDPSELFALGALHNALLIELED